MVPNLGSYGPGVTDSAGRNLRTWGHERRLGDRLCSATALANDAACSRRSA